MESTAWALSVEHPITSLHVAIDPPETPGGALVFWHDADGGHSFEIALPSRCAFCGAEFVEDGIDVIRAHILTCDKHPLSRAGIRREAIPQSLAAAVAQNAVGQPEGLTDHEVVGAFVMRAQMAMLAGMERGLARGWGLSFRRDYADRDVDERLLEAVDVLETALVEFRNGGKDPAVLARFEAALRQRAADVANQAFMLADAERLERNR